MDKMNRTNPQLTAARTLKVATTKPSFADQHRLRSSPLMKRAISPVAKKQGIDLYNPDRWPQLVLNLNGESNKRYTIKRVRRGVIGITELRYSPLYGRWVRDWEFHFWVSETKKWYIIYSWSKYSKVKYVAFDEHDLPTKVMDAEDQRERAKYADTFGASMIIGNWFRDATEVRAK